MQGLRKNKDIGYDKILKKELCCNGNVINDKELGSIIPLQGDQHQKVFKFLVQAGLVLEYQVEIHGF